MSISSDFLFASR